MRQEPDHGEATYRGSGRLLDRAAIVTGGDSGIGRAVALAFAREGADVLLSYLPDEQADAERTADLIADAGRKAVPVPGDIRTATHCQDIARQAVESFGRIDILVNNAAFQMAQSGGIDAFSDEQFDRVMKTNVYAMFWLCKASVPHMPRGSTIINTSSIQATHPSPQLLDYATTKGAIVTFTLGLSAMLADRGIRVNAVAPGPIWTPLIPATMTEDKKDDFGMDTPLGRAGQPAELAPAFVYLASTDSSYVTGAVLPVTGGRFF